MKKAIFSLLWLLSIIWVACTDKGNEFIVPPEQKNFTEFADCKCDTTKENPTRELCKRQLSNPVIIRDAVGYIKAKKYAYITYLDTMYLEDYSKYNIDKNRIQFWGKRELEVCNMPDPLTKTLKIVKVKVDFIVYDEPIGGPYNPQGNFIKLLKLEVIE
jgi:hypothetical protein